MKNVTALLICLLASFSLFSKQVQPVGEVGAETTLTVRERYLLMKSKSQSFKDYKVIKETVLDGVWKIFQDSLHAKQVNIAQANDSLKKLNASVQLAKVTLKEKEDSVAMLTHAGTHVTLLGIDLLKSVFITIALSIIAGSIFFTVILLGRLKIMHINLTEKTGSFDTIQLEFQEYKRKAMEKQTKLSRELQDERNKVQGQRSS